MRSLHITEVRYGVHLHVRTCTPLYHAGASPPARLSPIKVSYWFMKVSFYYIPICIMCIIRDLDTGQAYRKITYPKPRDRQATAASVTSQWKLQTVRQGRLFLLIITSPSLHVGPPASLYSSVIGIMGMGMG